VLQEIISSPATTNWLLVAITAVYCYLTFKIVQKNDQIVSQMRAQYAAFVAPVITINILLKHSVVICLKIKNAGNSPAKNLRLSIDRDFYQFADAKEEKNVRSFPLFNKPFPSFGPGEEVFLMLSQGFNLNKKEEGKLVTPLQFKITAAFEFGGQGFSSEHEIDLAAYMKTSQDRSEILEELEKIRKALESK
jgi:hypothetical protein